MKRTQLQLDQLLRRRAFEQGTSMAALVRRILGEHLRSRPARGRALEDFKFVGSGRSDEGGVEPISERHDKALAEDLAR